MGITAEPAARPAAPSRRTITRGIAWSIPVVVGVGFAPRASASPGGPVTLGATASACKIPGCSDPNPDGACKQYLLLPAFTNSSTTETVTVQIVSIVPVGQTWTLVPGDSTLNFDLAPGQSLTPTVEITSTNSANASATISYVVTVRSTNYQNQGSVLFVGTGVCK